MRNLSHQVRCHFFIVLALSSVLYQGIMGDPVAAGPSKEADARGPDGEGAMPRPLERDGKKYTVEQFSIEYDTPDNRLPAVSQLQKIPVKLGRTSQGLVAPREGISVVRGTVGTITDVSHEFYASAIRQICMDIVSELKRQGVLGVYVTVPRSEVDRTGNEEDRPRGRKLTLRIETTRLSKVRTKAYGDRFSGENRINLPAYSAILEESPLQPTGDAAGTDLLLKAPLDAYVYRLNRHPGRKVDVAVSGGDESGTATLDYIVAENKPWIVYTGASNTGTESTGQWRERFGVVHNQLGGNDDILSLNYITSGFDETHAVQASYQFPLKWLYLDGRVFGSWDQYTASDVGLSNEEFRGEGWNGGAEVISNVFQQKRLFVDLIAGARWEDIRVHNEAVSMIGDESFLLPYVGLQVERKSQTASTYATVNYETNWASVAGTEPQDMARLGRLDSNEDWEVCHWHMSQSLFLEPLLYPSSWKDFDTPETSTLAHELVVSFSGQYAFDKRLPPTAQKVIGGSHTVRGYPESAVSGDNGYAARFEYKYHLPRSFQPRPTTEKEPPQIFGRSFRMAPTHLLGRPDWDLVLSAFYDWGRVTVNDPFRFETNEELASCGVGLELQIWENLNLYCDYGYALKDLDNGEAEAGHDEIHFGVTLLY